MNPGRLNHYTTVPKITTRKLTNLFLGRLRHGDNHACNGTNNGPSDKRDVVSPRCILQVAANPWPGKAGESPRRKQKPVIASLRRRPVELQTRGREQRKHGAVIPADDRRQ